MYEARDKAYKDLRDSEDYRITILHDLQNCYIDFHEIETTLSQYAFNAGWEARKKIDYKQIMDSNTKVFDD